MGFSHSFLKKNEIIQSVFLSLPSVQLFLNLSHEISIFGALGRQRGHLCWWDNPCCRSREFKESVTQRGCFYQVRLCYDKTLLNTITPSMQRVSAQLSTHLYLHRALPVFCHRNSSRNSIYIIMAA